VPSDEPASRVVSAKPISKDAAMVREVTNETKDEMLVMTGQKPREGENLKL